MEPDDKLSRGCDDAHTGNSGRWKLYIALLYYFTSLWLRSKQGFNGKVKDGVHKASIHCMQQCQFSVVQWNVFLQQQQQQRGLISCIRRKWFERDRNPHHWHGGHRQKTSSEKQVCPSCATISLHFCWWDLWLHFQQQSGCIKLPRAANYNAMFYGTLTLR